MDALLGPQPSRLSPAKRRRRREGTLSAPPSSRLMAPSDTDLRSWVSLPPELSGWRGAAVWPELRFSNSERRRGGHWARRRSQRRRLSDSLLPPVLLSRTHLPIHPSRRRSFAGFMLDGGDPAEEVKPSLLTASPGLQVDIASVRCGFSASDLSDIIFTSLLSMVAEGSRGSDAKGQWKVFLGH